jgi:hypothetical protein
MSLMSDLTVRCRTRLTQGRVRRTLWIGVFCVTFPGILLAQSLTLTFQTVGGGLSLSGSGTDTASMNFGTVSAYAPLGAGITRSNGATDYTIGSDFGLMVVKNGRGGGPNYLVRARLTGSNPLTWSINGVAMTTTLTTVANNQPYGSTVPYALEFVVPVASAAGAASATFEVQAIAN